MAVRIMNLNALRTPATVLAWAKDTNCNAVRVRPNLDECISLICIVTVHAQCIAYSSSRNTECIYILELLFVQDKIL